MKRALALIGFALCLSCNIAAQVAVFSSCRENVCYDFRITQQQLAHAPKWPTDKASPPLPPRRAASIGTAYVRDLFTDATDWHLSSIELVPLGNDSWVYLVALTAPPFHPLRNCADCFSGSFSFKAVVLMDGTAVKAEQHRTPD